MISRYYDKKGNPIGLLQWADLFKDKEYRIIKQEKVGKFFISTVWLGADYSCVEGRILIFETMVFDKKGNDVDMERYTTLNEAIEGHKKIVNKKLKEG